MLCTEVRDLSDSFLSEQLLVETNHEILRHLETCPQCRAALATRRSLRASIRRAFTNAEELRISGEFRKEVVSRLREVAFRKSGRIFARRWVVGFAVAALLLIAAGFGQLLRPARYDALAFDAVGDHQNCAMQFRLAEKPFSLEESAARYGGWFRLLEDTPSDEWTTPMGSVRVVNRHSCVFQGRRFAHIVLQVQGQIVSLLVTPKDGQEIRTVHGEDHLPALVSPPSVDGFWIESFQTPKYMIYIVGSVAERQLRQVARSISGPLAERLAGS